MVENGSVSVDLSSIPHYAAYKLGERVMDLYKQIQERRSEVVTDSYEMSIGELMNMYAEDDIIINPEYQRLFRWEAAQRSRFIESILLGLPTPSIFVYQLENGKWELIDGLQRVSTILQFTGLLRDYPHLTLEATSKLPLLEGNTWESLDNSLHRDYKRSRIRVEILKNTSDKLARYELFQRLNTGGAELSDQEVRNCILIMLNPQLATWVKNLAKYKNFIESVGITDVQINKEYDSELVLRFFAYKNFGYDKKIDVNVYLDEFSKYIAQETSFNTQAEEAIFTQTFDTIRSALGEGAFKRRDQSGRPLGQFLITKFEVIAYGVAKNLTEIMKRQDKDKFISEQSILIDTDTTYKKNSGPGSKASSRLESLLNLGEQLFKS